MFDSASSTASASSQRPLPLKQRTSSVDTRRDFNTSTWRSLLVLLKAREYFFTVDTFSIWRRHLAWSSSGISLRSYLTQRFGTNMVFLSLLLSTELGILFNSSPITLNIRVELKNADYTTVSFWAGLFIIVSALLTLLGLFATFTAWAMVSAVDEHNAHCIFRSSIGQYAAELPGRLIVGSVYTFLVAFFFLFFLLLPVGFAILLLTIGLCLFIHVVATFSALGRIIMHTGAMGSERIFKEDYEMTLLPHSLHANLLSKARANLANNTSITRQYRKRQAPIDRHYSNESELYSHLSSRSAPSAIDTSFRSPDTNETTKNKMSQIREDEPYRRRTDSLVRFADEDIVGGVIASSFQPNTSTESRTPDHDSSKNNSRSLTSSMSDLSPSPANFGRKQNEAPLSLPFSGSNPRPPRPKPSMRNSPFRSSSSSLEQWLQATPSPSQEQQSYAGDGISSSSIQPRPVRRSPPPPPLADSNGTMPLPQIPPPNEIRTHKRDNSAGMSSIGTYDRQMSEDDRFMIDYGDDNYDGSFVDALDDDANERSPPDENLACDSGSTDDDVENQGLDPERVSLLENGDSNPRYDATEDISEKKGPPMMPKPRFSPR